MARSLKKGPFVSIKLAKKVAIATESNKLANGNPELFMSRVSLLTNAEIKMRKENQITGDLNGF